MPSDYAKKKAQKKKEAAKQKGGKKPKETESGNFLLNVIQISILL